MTLAINATIVEETGSNRYCVSFKNGWILNIITICSLYCFQPSIFVNIQIHYTMITKLVNHSISIDHNVNNYNDSSRRFWFIVHSGRANSRHSPNVICICSCFLKHPSYCTTLDCYSLIMVCICFITSMTARRNEILEMNINAFMLLRCIHSSNSRIVYMMDMQSTSLYNQSIKCIFINLKSIFTMIITLCMTFCCIIITLTQLFVNYVVISNNCNKSYYEIVLNSMTYIFM